MWITLLLHIYEGGQGKRREEPSVASQIRTYILCMYYDGSAFIGTQMEKRHLLNYFIYWQRPLMPIPRGPGPIFELF